MTEKMKKMKIMLVCVDCVGFRARDSSVDFHWRVTGHLNDDDEFVTETPGAGACRHCHMPGEPEDHNFDLAEVSFE